VVWEPQNNDDKITPINLKVVKKIKVVIITLGAQ